MLDKSVPYVKIIMRRRKGSPVTEIKLPAGFSFAFFKPNDEYSWAAIETSVLEFSCEEEALSYFKKEFYSHISELVKRCVFIESEKGYKVATGMAWWDNINGKRVPKLHWVSVKPEYQGIGLGKAIVSRVMQLLLELESDTDFLLHTQTWSYKAVGIYKKFNFYITDENGDYEQAIEILGRRVKMSGIEFSKQFTELFNHLRLGAVEKDITELSGGFLHKMYLVESVTGRYAVKALNPQIMLRPTAKQDIINSERIANIAKEYIPAMAAEVFDGNSMIEYNGQYYLIYHFIEGRVLKQSEVTAFHAGIIGGILASLHNIDFSMLNIKDGKQEEEQLTDWGFYYNKGLEENAVWAELLHENLDRLYEWNKSAVSSLKALLQNRVVSHRDLDCKNVMWNGEKSVIIDWEAAGYVNFAHDLVETALYWSKDEFENYKEDKFKAFVKAYKNKRPLINADWDAALSRGYSSMLGWLEYSLKRSLKLECADPAEVKMGTEHVTGTLNELNKYAGAVQYVKLWLEECVKNNSPEGNVGK